MVRAKKSKNAVWEPRDKKVNGCQHYTVFQPPPLLPDATIYLALSRSSNLRNGSSEILPEGLSIQGGIIKMYICLTHTTRALVLLSKSVFRFLKFLKIEYIFQELMNRCQACLYTFECNYHCDSKYSDGFQRFQ